MWQKGAKPEARKQGRAASKAPRPAAPAAPSGERAAHGSWIPQEWLDTLERCRREYGIEGAHVTHLHTALFGSATLRSLVESPEPGPHRAWLCFLSLIDVFLDPLGNGLPLPLMHPPRLTVPPGTFAVDWKGAARQGFLRGTTLVGKMSQAVVSRLTAEAVRIRRRAETLHAGIKREGAELLAHFPGGTYTSAEIAEFQSRHECLVLRSAEVRALVEAASVLETQARESGPHVFDPAAGEPPSRHGALICLLDFALRTDATLADAERLDLIAAVVEEFLPGALGRKGAEARAHHRRSTGRPPPTPRERVRLALVGAARSAEEAEVRARQSGAVPFDAIATFTATALIEAHLIQRSSMAEVLAAPNDRGVPRDGARHGSPDAEAPRAADRFRHLVPFKARGHRRVAGCGVARFGRWAVALPHGRSGCVEEVHAP